MMVACSRIRGDDSSSMKDRAIRLSRIHCGVCMYEKREGNIRVQYMYSIACARSGPCAHQLSLPSLVTVPVTSVVCVATINLACPNLARYYFALLFPGSAGSQLVYFIGSSDPLAFLRRNARRPFYYEDNRNKTYRCFLNKEAVRLGRAEFFLGAYKGGERREEERRKKINK